MLATNLAQPRLAAPLGAPTRSARVVSGFSIRQVFLDSGLVVVCTSRLGDVYAQSHSLKAAHMGASAFVGSDVYAVLR